jgi:hypothetical protein
LVEKELKYELTKAHYLKLIKVLKPRKNQSLVNYYFDDTDLQLRRKKFALRIRIVSGGKAYFTLKYPGKTIIFSGGFKSLALEIKRSTNMAKVTTAKLTTIYSRAKIRQAPVTFNMYPLGIVIPSSFGGSPTSNAAIRTKISAPMMNLAGYCLMR